MKHASWSHFIVALTSNVTARANLGTVTNKFARYSTVGMKLTNRSSQPWDVCKCPNTIQSYIAQQFAIITIIL